MLSFKIATAVSVISLTLLPHVPADYQVLTAQDKESIFVYEVVNRPGTIYYDETGEPTFARKFPRVGSMPALGIWKTTHRSERKFGATSRTPSFGEMSTLGSGDAAAWLFRHPTSHDLSAVSLGLRGANAPVGGSTSTSARTIRIDVPAQTEVYAAVLFRAGCKDVRVDFSADGFSYIEGDDESTGGYVLVGANRGMAPATVEIDGRKAVVVHSIPTNRKMTMTATPQGNDIVFLTGRFASEPACFAAVLLMKKP